MIAEERVRSANAKPVHRGRDYVLYWMTSARRTRFNAGLEHAISRARSLAKPLWVLEALRCGSRWSTPRVHAFVLRGMAQNRDRFAATPVGYLPYIEPEVGQGQGLLASLASRAATVVTDEFPSHFLPRMIAAAAEALDVRLEVVDSNGLLPLSRSQRPYPTAYAFRRFVQAELRDALGKRPLPDPLHGLELPPAPPLDSKILERWPQASSALLAADPAALAALPLDHGVEPVELATAERDRDLFGDDPAELPPGSIGGSEEAEATLEGFLDERLPRYGEERNQPERGAQSFLSAHLHFGHLSVHDVFARLEERFEWSPERLTKKRDGKRDGFWNLPAEVESFLDEIVTWRELGYHFAHHVPDHDRYRTLPPWAQETLAEHADDPRPQLYDLDTLEAARTHDPLWNAAQNQLRVEGRIHNYLRMLWGKKILQWSESPEVALEHLIQLNNRWALDGRNPNSYSGIFWTLGRFDRAWGPERPIFGKIRYMTSENTARKVKVKGYIAKHGG